MRLFLALAALTLLGCSEDHTGFYCPPNAFSGDDCRMRLQSSGCMDGGVITRGNADAGTEMLCCEWQSCTKDPYPEL